MSPCPRCGGSQRYADGRCAPCTRAVNQRWKEANREAHRGGSRRWALQNPDAVRGHGREYGRRHLRKIAAYKRAWAARNPEMLVAQAHARKARITSNGGTYRAGEWLLLCQSYGNRCLCCGRSEALLTVDHIVPVASGGRNEIANIQPLCGPCNSSKGTRTIDYRTRWDQSEVPIQLDLFGETA